MENQMFDYTGLMPSGTQVDALHKARQEATSLPRPVPKEWIGEVYKTAFKNERRGATIVYDDNGGKWKVIPPGGELMIKSWSPRTMYAPFSRITFERGPQLNPEFTQAENDSAFGKVSVTRRAGFRDPAEDSEWWILLDNREGASEEGLKIDGDKQIALRGIPRKVPVSLVDPRIGYRAIVWRRKVEKVPFKSNTDYLVPVVKVEMVLVPRKASELKAIKKAIEKRVLEDARRITEQTFQKIRPVEVDDAETEGQAD